MELPCACDSTFSTILKESKLSLYKTAAHSLVHQIVKLKLSGKLESFIHSFQSLQIPSYRFELIIAFNSMQYHSAVHAFSEFRYERLIGLDLLEFLDYISNKDFSDFNELIFLS